MLRVRGVFTVALFFALLALVLPAFAVAQDATLDATLTYVGPGPGSTSVYRYDYTLTNNAVTPQVIELLVFFDSDPDSGVIFLGDNSDFNNTTGFTGSASGPSGWVTDVFEDPDPNPWVVDFFNFDGSNAIAPGQSLSGFSVTFLWKGEGTPGEQFFEALDGFAHEGRSTLVQVNFPPITGSVTAGCTGAPLGGVIVDLYNEYGNLMDSTFTEADGSFTFLNLPPGNYTINIVTPIGYEDPGDIPVSLGSPADIVLECLPTSGEPRTIGFWKHQVNVYLRGKGKAQVHLDDLLSYLDTIYEHFDQSQVHPVEVYAIPTTATDTEKLNEAKVILTVNHKGSMNLRARQQLMALLLNVASLKLGQTDVISDDGATVSQAITYAWDLIADADPGNDETAKTLADEINNGRMVGAGIIPLATPIYTYEAPGTEIRQIAGRTMLQPNFPNPVGAAGTDIRFRAADAGPVALELFDVHGRLVRTLYRGPGPSAETTLHWDGRDQSGAAVADGLYFYRLTTRKSVETQKLILAR